MQKTEDFCDATVTLDFGRLRALCAEKPETTMAVIRAAWPHIQMALRSGHTLKRICHELNEDGFAIGYKTLSAYVGRLRRQQARRAELEPRSGGLPSARSVAAPASRSISRPDAHDPMANAREYSTGKRPGFHFTGEPPDPEKLF